MNTEVIVAILSLVGTLAGSFMGVYVSGKLVNFRLDALEKRVEKLCQLTERVAVVEHDIRAASGTMCKPEYSLKQ
jgi:predicted ester cyclase